MIYRGYIFSLFTDFLYIIWYPFYKGRLFILLFPSWTSYRKISASYRILPVPTTTCSNGGNAGPKFCNGNLLFTLSWTVSNGFLFDESWTSTPNDGATLYVNRMGAWTIGNTGYYILYPGNNLTGTTVHRIQRPALYIFNNGYSK